MPDAFGSFHWLCSHAPLPQCNLFFSQYYNDPSPDLTILFPSNSSFFENYNVASPSLPLRSVLSFPFEEQFVKDGADKQTSTDFADDPNVMAARSDAGVELGSDCQIPRAGQQGSLGDIALIVLSGVSLLVIGYLTVRGNKRIAAVGRVELRTLLVAYMLNLIFQILTMTSLFEQGTLVISVLTAIHLAIFVLGYWLLVANAIVSTQWIDDGTITSLVPTAIIGLLLFAPTLYISLDTSQNWTNTFTLGDNVEAKTLFVLTLIWPAAAAVIYGILMIYVSLRMLGEVKPAIMYFLAGLLFAGSQAVFFLASQPLCNASDRKINSSFLACLLQTASMIIMYFAWECITEDNWPLPHQNPNDPYNYGAAEYGQPY